MCSSWLWSWDEWGGRYLVLDEWEDRSFDGRQLGVKLEQRALLSSHLHGDVKDVERREGDGGGRIWGRGKRGGVGGGAGLGIAELGDGIGSGGPHPRNRRTLAQRASAGRRQSRARSRGAHTSLCAPEARGTRPLPTVSCGIKGSCVGRAWATRGEGGGRAGRDDGAEGGAMDGMVVRGIAGVMEGAWRGREGGQRRTMEGREGRVAREGERTGRANGREGGEGGERRGWWGGGGRCVG